MEPDIKAILKRRIAGAMNQIADSESKIASEELYRNKWQIRKDAFENILEEWNELQKQNADIALAKEAMNTHVHIYTENPRDPIIQADPHNIDKMAKHIENANRIIAANQELFDEIIPFKEVPAFNIDKSAIPQIIGKTKVYAMGNNIVIYREQYHINIFTTIEEIKRMKSLPEMTVKLTLQDYEKRTYPNKAVVLRHFLRDLKDVNELNIEIAPKPHKPIPTFSKMSDLDKIQK